jgi:hypothetical protein
METFQEKCIIQALKKNFSQDEIMSMIPSETLKDIKAKNEHPYFNVYSVAHDGISNPKIIGEKASPIYWSRQAIQSIKNIVLKGVKFFIGHNEDNSTDNRKYIGEVIANKEIEIDDKLHHVVIGYFPDKKEAEKYNICSQESIWNFIKQGSKIVADKIEEMTGIALSNSNYDKPAFSGAMKLAELQCFEDHEKLSDEEKLRNIIAKQDEYLRMKLNP